MKPLGWYLAKIEKQEAVSKRAFLSAWAQADLNINFALSVFAFGDQDRDLVTIKQAASFEQLKGRYRPPGTRNSRIEAAVAGNSHAVRVNGSLILTRNLDNHHPEVVVLGPEGLALPRPLKSQALIIENLQNFLLLKETLDFAEFHSELIGHNVEVLFGDGNAITNALHHDFLNEFHKTWWLMDADPGGFKIIANALNFLSPSRVEIVVPSDLQHRLKSHGIPLSQNDRDNVMALASKHEVLERMAEPVVNEHSQLEQETYLLAGWEAPQNEC